jgi:hypothetical protein
LSDLLSQLVCQQKGIINVLDLRRLLSSSQKDDQCGAPLQVLDPVSRSIVDPQLRHASPNEFDVTRIAADDVRPHSSLGEKLPMRSILKPNPLPPA